MVSVSVGMDLTAVVPALMYGIAQELGVDVNELKVILVGDEHQVDLKPFQTLQTQYPTKCDPDNCHTAETAPSEDEAAALANAAHTRAIMSGEAPPQLGSGQPSHMPAQPTPKSSGAPPAPASSAGAPTRTGYTVADQSSTLIQPGRIYQTPQTPAPLPYRVTIPVSREACRSATSTTQWNEKDFTTGEWSVWYLSEEIGTDLFQQRFQHIKPPSDALVQASAEVEDNYDFGPDNGIVKRFTPVMAKRPLYHPPAAAARPVEPEFSPFWTHADCQDIPDSAWLQALWLRLQARCGGA